MRIVYQMTASETSFSLFLHALSSVSPYTDRTPRRDWFRRRQNYFMV